MMGHRDPIKNGDEHDLVTGWRKVMKYIGRPGVARSIKNKINRRARQTAKDAIQEAATEQYDYVLDPFLGERYEPFYEEHTRTEAFLNG